MKTPKSSWGFALRKGGKPGLFGGLLEVSGEVAKKVTHIGRKSGGKGVCKGVPKSVPKGVRISVPKGVCKCVCISVGKGVWTGVRKGGGKSGCKGGGEGVGKGGAHTPEKWRFSASMTHDCKSLAKGRSLCPCPLFFPPVKNSYGAVRLKQYRHRQSPPCQPSTRSRTASLNNTGTAQHMNRRASESSHRIKRISNNAIITTGNRYIISRSWNIVRDIMRLWYSDNAITA